MEKISQFLPDTTIVTSVSNSVTHYSNNSSKPKKTFIEPHQADSIIAKVTHLITDKSYTRWYYTQLFVLGERQFLLCAEIASTADHPANCFTYWLKHPDKVAQWLQYKR